MIGKMLRFESHWKLVRRVLIGLCLVLSLERSTAGQTWSGLGGDNLWSNPDNWIGGASPVSGDTTQILFDHALNAQYVSNQDLSSPFVANQLAVSGTFGGPQQFTIGGGPISIQGSNSKLNGSLSELIFQVDVAVQSQTEITGSMSFRRSLDISSNVTNNGVIAVSTNPGQFSAGSVTISNNAVVETNVGQMFLVVRGSIEGTGNLIFNNSDLNLIESDLNIPVLFNGAGRLLAGSSERDTFVTSDVTFSGPSSRLDIFQFNGKVVNFDGRIFVPSGSLTINNTGNGNGIISGLGSIEVDASAEVRTASNVTVELDSIVSGALSVNGNLVGDVSTNVGSVLAGTGLITGLVDVGGELAPGNSAGTIGIDGTIDIDTDAMVCIELGGTIAGVGGFDSISGQGSSSAFLDGTLELMSLGNFMPAAGDTFDIFSDFGSISGTFKNTQDGRIAYESGWFDITYGTSFVRLSNFTITAVPEPSSAVLTVLGIAMMGYRRRS